MTFEYDNALSELLFNIEESLVQRTPRQVAGMKVSEPVYAVFLWYCDSSAGDGFAPGIGVGLESMRLTCRETYRDRASVNDCIWRPQQVIPEQVPRRRFKERRLIEKCNEAYSLMLAANTTGLPVEDERELLQPFRSMMHRVAARLYEFEWRAVISVVEEFAVVACDEIGNWVSEDLQQCVPGRIWNLLQQNGLVGVK